MVFSAAVHTTTITVQGIGIASRAKLESGAKAGADKIDIVFSAAIHTRTNPVQAHRHCVTSTGGARV